MTLGETLAVAAVIAVVAVWAVMTASRARAQRRVRYRGHPAARAYGPLRSIYRGILFALDELIAACRAREVLDGGAPGDGQTDHGEIDALAARIAAGEEDATPLVAEVAALADGPSAADGLARLRADLPEDPPDQEAQDPERLTFYQEVTSHIRALSQDYIEQHGPEAQARLMDQLDTPEDTGLFREALVALSPLLGRDGGRVVGQAIVDRAEGSAVEDIVRALRVCVLPINATVFGQIESLDIRGYLAHPDRAVLAAAIPAAQQQYAYDNDRSTDQAYLDEIAAARRELSRMPD